MGFVTWEQDLSVGVNQMDRDHQELIRLMNELFDINEKTPSTPNITQAMDKLISFTKKHFADEEAHMFAINYPGYDSHKLIHEDLLGKLARHYDDYRKVGGKLPNTIFSFLKLWLTAHIKGVDKKYNHIPKSMAA